MPRPAVTIVALLTTLRSEGATHYYQDTPSGVVFVYRSRDGLVEVREVRKVDGAWKQGWHCPRQWIAREPAEIPAVARVIEEAI